MLIRLQPRNGKNFTAATHILYTCFAGSGFRNDAAPALAMLTYTVSHNFVSMMQLYLLHKNLGSSSSQMVVRLLVSPAPPNMVRLLVAPGPPNMMRFLVAPAPPNMARLLVAPAPSNMVRLLLAPAAPGGNNKNIPEFITMKITTKRRIILLG
jgi:hypothetical protein